ncbi:hypothetical protein GCM10009812_37930 [Nocardioides marinus]|uniref:Uncharacterized protein n=1 Tax=Nocardioides marinus TaxID=374514 RepID=A0A7Y9YGM4_9ACTN|nr:hypothetical protein [Nocardioides marinus]NYI11880.1 hypothetical protein [Nocardioides marinus]
MTPSTLPARRLLAATVLPLLALTACGGDDSSAADPPTTTPGAADVAAGFDEALETVEELPEDTVLDAVGQAVVTVLSAASGYEIEDGTLYVTVDGGSENALSNCQIVLGAAGALTDDPSVVLRYDSEDVDCSEVS